MRKIFIYLIYGLLLCFNLIKVEAEVATFHIRITNSWDIEKKGEPIVFKLQDFGVDFSIRSSKVYIEGKEIASQLDDLNGDGILDELVFIVDIPSKTTQNIQLEFSSAEIPNTYCSKVYAEMLLSNPSGEHIPIQSLTIPTSSLVYNHLHHHGPAFESELVAYRIYFDKKQTVDIYGKFNKQLEIERSQFYPTDEQLQQGFGDDVLLVGNSCGLGTLKGWNGKQATHIENARAFTETIRAYGPIRTVVDIISHDWHYQNSILQMNIRYILYAGHRDCEVQVSFNEPLDKKLFCTGLLQIKDSYFYSNHRGCMALWGTHWPVNDTIKYAKETVGLAISLPEEIVYGETEDSVNHLYVIKPNHITSFTYHVVFTSKKETFGFIDEKEWFRYVSQWDKQLKQTIQIEFLNSTN